jgi:hypothetical protein
VTRSHPILNREKPPTPTADKLYSIISTRCSVVDSSLVHQILQ